MGSFSWFFAAFGFLPFSWFFAALGFLPILLSIRLRQKPSELEAEYLLYLNMFPTLDNHWSGTIVGVDFKEEEDGSYVILYVKLGMCLLFNYFIYNLLIILIFYSFFLFIFIIIHFLFIIHNFLIYIYFNYYTFLFFCLLSKVQIQLICYRTAIGLASLYRVLNLKMIKSE